MDETLDELLSMLPQQETYLEGLQRFSAEHRRLEWLSVRVLVFTLLGEEKEIAYYPSGKPGTPWPVLMRFGWEKTGRIPEASGAVVS